MKNYIIGGHQGEVREAAASPVGLLHGLATDLTLDCGRGSPYTDI